MILSPSKITSRSGSSLENAQLAPPSAEAKTPSAGRETTATMRGPEAKARSTSTSSLIDLKTSKRVCS